MLGRVVAPVLFAWLVLSLALQVLPADKAQASNVQVLLTQSCSTTQPGRVRVSFTWQGKDASASQEWLDLSLFDNGWQTGTFLGAGPLSSATTAFNWDGLLSSRDHFVRVNQRLAAGSWDPSPTYHVVTIPCAGPVAMARTQLSMLVVKAEAPMTGYSRDQFGQPWEDVDDNNCDTRNDILRRDLTNIVLRTGSACIVERGTLADPYTGKTISFLRGPSTSLAVQIDHVVALGDTWRTGSAAWDTNKRLQYANDPLVLLAVDGPSNNAKGDKDAAHWLPPSLVFHCPYVERQISIKAKYTLWVTQAEHDAMLDELADCDDEMPAPAPPAPSGSLPPAPAPAPSTPDGHTWYTSAAATATVYYCDQDSGWKNLSPANLRSFTSVQALLTMFPSRTKSASSKC